MLKHALTTAALAAAVITIPAPAEASVLGGSVRHLSPDNGYDAALVVMCDGGRLRRVAEGVSSDSICNDEDVDAIYVREGEEWWTRGGRHGAIWQKAYDRTGWHDWPGPLNGAYAVKKD